MCLPLKFVLLLPPKKKKKTNATQSKLDGNLTPSCSLWNHCLVPSGKSFVVPQLSHSVFRNSKVLWNKLFRKVICIRESAKWFFLRVPPSCWPLSKKKNGQQKHQTLCKHKNIGILSQNVEILFHLSKSHTNEHIFQQQKKRCVEISLEK